MRSSTLSGPTMDTPPGACVQRRALAPWCRLADKLWELVNGGVDGSFLRRDSRAMGADGYWADTLTVGSLSCEAFHFFRRTKLRRFLNQCCNEAAC
jgi:hypothetical protein